MNFKKQSKTLEHSDQTIGALNIELNVVNQLNNIYSHQNTFTRTDIMQMLVVASQRLKDKQQNEMKVLAESEVSA